MSSPIKKSYIFLLLTLLGLLVFFNSSSPTLALRVGISPWPGYETLFLARGLGYIDKPSIKLVELSSATEVMHALRNDSLEVATLTLDEVLELLSTGVELTIVAVMNVSIGADAVLAQPEYKSLHDLKGKRIGVESTAIGAVILDGAMQQAEMQLSDFTLVPLAINKYVPAFAQNKIEAVVTFEPIKSFLVSQGAVTLYDSSQIPGRIVNVLVVRSSILEKHSDTICSLVEAQLQAREYFYNSPKEAAQKMVSRLHIPTNLFLKNYQGLSLPGLAMNWQLLSQGELSLQKNAKELSELMLDRRLIKYKPNLSHLVDDRCIVGENVE